MMAYRRRVLFRMDHLVIGASPEKLAAQREVLAAVVPAALSVAERIRLSELNTRRLVEGPLCPAETYEREQLLRRRSH
jgi:hypothetical protein